MNYRSAPIRVDDTLRNVVVASRPADDCEDESADDDVDDALTQRVCSSVPPVDLLRALPAMSANDVITPPPSTLTLSPRFSCRACDVQRRWSTRVATVPVASDAACSCLGWVSAKPTQHSPSVSISAPPPIPRRSRTLSTDRRRRINDAYSTSGNADFADVELAPSSLGRHFNCFRFCCVRSVRRSTDITDVVGLTTVCRCSAVVDNGNGSRNSHRDELHAKRGGRRRQVAHVLIACIVALPVTCLLLLVGLCLLLTPLYQSTTGTCSSCSVSITLTQCW